jgi:hypothetical protein
VRSTAADRRVVLALAAFALGGAALPPLVRAVDAEQRVHDGFCPGPDPLVPRAFADGLGPSRRFPLGRAEALEPWGRPWHVRPRDRALEADIVGGAPAYFASGAELAAIAGVSSDVAIYSAGPDGHDDLAAPGTDDVPITYHALSWMILLDAAPILAGWTACAALLAWLLGRATGDLPLRRQAPLFVVVYPLLVAGHARATLAYVVISLRAIERLGGPTAIPGPLGLPAHAAAVGTLAGLLGLLYIVGWAVTSAKEA